MANGWKSKPELIFTVLEGRSRARAMEEISVSQAALDDLTEIEAIGDNFELISDDELKAKGITYWELAKAIAGQL